MGFVGWQYIQLAFYYEHTGKLIVFLQLIVK